MMPGQVRRSPAITSALILVAILAVAALLTDGCGSKTDSTQGLLQLGETHGGRTFDVAVGETVEVVLEGNPTTGYEWTSALSEKDAALVEQQGEPKYVAQSTDPSLLGSGGTYTFTFKTIAKGEAKLKLVYARPFESSRPDRTFEVTLKIK